MTRLVHTKALYLLVFAIVFVASFFKIADLDFWWHLKTGQVILQQKAFQYHEIYSFTVPGREYIDHEWLFQVIEYWLYGAAGPAGVILAKCAMLLCVYLLTARFLLKNNACFLIALGILLLSVLGGRSRFIERPELFTALFLVMLYLLIDNYIRTGLRNRLLIIPPLMLIWSNIHAAVILGLVLQVAFIAGLLMERVAEKSDYPVFYNADRYHIITLITLLFISLLATGANPYGFRTLKVPFELTAIINSGLLQNQEWQQPPLLYLPFYYVCLAFTLGLIAIHFRRLHFTNFLLAAFFGYISMKYVRNVGLFCILMPLFVAPYVEALSAGLKRARVAVGVVIGMLLVILVTSSPFEFGIGIASHFPKKMVKLTRLENLQGHMINSYGFGGYLIWALYPERKIFIDGRNEVYLPLLKEVVAARGDSRSWKKLLDKYQIEYALLNYVDQLEELTVINQNNEANVTYAPFTSTHFPRSQWALIYWDDVGMILVKRNGVNQKLLPMEYTAVFPEGKLYQESLVRAGRIDRARALQELQRKLHEDPSCQRALFLLTAMEGIEH